MKTILQLKKLFIIPLLFLVGNVWGQITYTGPIGSSSVTCPSGTVGSSCGLTFNPKYKLYINSISGSTVNLVIEVCTGSSLSTGTFYLKEGDACGTQIDSWSVSGTSGPYYRSINVSHTGTKNYTLTNINTAGTARTYSNTIAITGTANISPTLKSESNCFVLDNTSINEGGNFSGNITVRNIGNTAYNGNITIFISKTTSSSTQQIISQQYYSISSNSIQSIYFNQLLTVTPGTYRVWLKYDNAPNGGEQYLEDNNCPTCSGLGCLSTSTPSSLVAVIGIANLQCGTATVTPTNPIQNQSATFSFPIQNIGSANYTGTLSLWWRNTSNIGIQLGSSLYGLSAGSPYTFNYTTPTVLQSAPGNYVLQIEDANGNVKCSKNVTVVAAPSCVQGSGTTPPTSSPEYIATNYLCDNHIIDPQQNWTTNYTTEIARKDIAKITYLGLFNGYALDSPALNFPVPFNDMQSINTNNSYWYNAAKVLAYLQYDDDKSPFGRDFIDFKPNDKIERRFAIKMFLEAFNILPSSSITNPYSDVPNSEPLLGYIIRANELGIITGNTISCSSGTCFHPYDKITRQDAFIVLWRLMTLSSITRPTYAKLTSSSSYFIPGNYRIANMNNVPSVDRANFNHYEKNVFSIPGSGLTLDFSFSYNSATTELPDDYLYSAINNSQHFIPLSKGWNYNYNNYIQNEPGYTYTDESGNVITVNPKVYIFWADGSINVFDRTLNRYETEGVYDTFQLIGNYIFITTKNQITYKFQSTASLDVYLPVDVFDRNSNTLHYTYAIGSNTPAIIANVKDLRTNRQINFTYVAVNGKDLIHTVSETGLNRTVTFNYNSYGNLSSYVDPKGQITYYNYYPTQDYNTANLLTEIILPKGNKIQNTYFNRKLQSSKTFAESGVVSSTTNVNWIPNYSTGQQYNSSSTITEPPTSVSPSGRTTSYTHNTLGNPTQIVSPTGTTSFNSFDANNANLPTSITINGQNSTISYDPNNGNVLSISKNGITNSFTYTAKNDVEYHTDGLGNVTHYTYDTAGNLTDITRPSGFGNTHIARNSFGQVTDVTNPSSIVTHFGYDVNGLTNLVSSPAVAGVQTTSEYDNASRLKKTFDGLLHQTRFEYDNNDNLVDTYDALNQNTNHIYDQNDNHLSIKNPKNETQTNVYNYDDDTLKSESFGLHTKSYTYNSDGTLATFTRGNGTFTYTYDATTGRLLNDSQTQYTYDTRGNIKTVVNTNGTLTLHYDVNDRMDYYDDYFGNRVSYTYDANNNVTDILYPGNKNVHYTYDAVNRCTDVTDWNTKNTHFEYETDDRIKKVTLPNGTYTDYTYDAAGRPTGISNKKANGTVISEYTFELDAIGNHHKEMITEPSITAGLTTISNQTVTYGQYPYNRIQSQGSTSFQHYTEGNISDKGSEHFTYDLNDNMLTAPNSTFSYDGAGNRRAKTVSGVNTRYVLSILGMSQVLMETNSSNAVQNYYVYGPTGLLYRVKADNTTYSYYHYDYRGSTTAITNEAQNITHSYSYDPFGKVLASVETDANPFQYVGQHGVQYENPSLTFMRARYYDPTTGRFVSEDPIWALNLYPYADNNPVMGIDPKGEYTEKTAGLVVNIMVNTKMPGSKIYKIINNSNENDLFYMLWGMKYKESDRYKAIYKMIISRLDMLIIGRKKRDNKNKEKQFEAQIYKKNLGPYKGSNFISSVTNTIPNVNYQKANSIPTWNKAQYNGTSLWFTNN